MIGELITVKIFYKIINWGLGHATRSLPLIRELTFLGHKVTVSSCGNALQLLKLELKDSCSFLNLPDINNSFLRDYHWAIILPKVMAIEIPQFLKSIKIENKLVEMAINKFGFDLIISDGCYGAVSNKLPCYFMGHHLKPLWFTKDRFSQKLIEKVLSTFLYNCTKILVPDYPGSPLSGSLSKNFTYIDKKKICYIGILSDYTKTKLPKNIDYLILISGHEPQRSSFQKIILQQVKYLHGKVVVCLGQTQEVGKKKLYGDDIEIYSFLQKSERDNLMNRANFVICRTGYSTLMDLLETRVSSALFVPTPNQTEQEYLSKIHHNDRNIWSVRQNKLNLKEDIIEARKLNLFQGRIFPNTKNSIINCLKIIFG